MLQLPGHAFASLDKLRSHVREVLRSASLQSAASAALDDMQVCTGVRVWGRQEGVGGGRVREVGQAGRGCQILLQTLNPDTPNNNTTHPILTRCARTVTFVFYSSLRFIP